MQLEQLADVFVTVLESDLLKMIAAALTDFAELNCYTALQLLLEVLTIIHRRRQITFSNFQNNQFE